MRTRPDIGLVIFVALDIQSDTTVYWACRACCCFVAAVIAAAVAVPVVVAALVPEIDRMFSLRYC